MENLTEQIKRLRKIKGWTQEELAQKMGISLSTVQRWERRGGKPIRIINRALQELFREAGMVEKTQNAPAPRTRHQTAKNS